MAQGLQNFFSIDFYFQCIWDDFKFSLELWTGICSIDEEVPCAAQSLQSVIVWNTVDIQKVNFFEDMVWILYLFVNI